MLQNYWVRDLIADQTAPGDGLAPTGRVPGIKEIVLHHAPHAPIAARTVHRVLSIRNDGSG